MSRQVRGGEGTEAQATKVGEKATAQGDLRGERAQTPLTSASVSNSTMP